MHLVTKKQRINGFWQLLRYFSLRNILTLGLSYLLNAIVTWMFFTSVITIPFSKLSHAGILAVNLLLPHIIFSCLKPALVIHNQQITRACSRQMLYENITKQRRAIIQHRFLMDSVHILGWHSNISINCRTDIPILSSDWFFCLLLRCKVPLR